MRLKRLCDSLDMDIQEFDYIAYPDYKELKRQILKKAGIVTEEMQKEEFEAWLAMAEFYDSVPLEEKASISENLISEAFPPNVLVLFIHRRYANLALAIIRWKFNGNILKSKNGKEKIDKRKKGSMTIWLFGKRETTEKIKTELLSHNIYFRILRDYPLRRDFLHFWKGKLYPISRRVLRMLTQPQTKIK